MGRVRPGGRVFFWSSSSVEDIFFSLSHDEDDELEDLRELLGALRGLKTVSVMTRSQDFAPPTGKPIITTCPPPPSSLSVSWSLTSRPGSPPEPPADSFSSTEAGGMDVTDEAARGLASMSAASSKSPLAFRAEEGPKRISVTQDHFNEALPFAPSFLFFCSRCAVAKTPPAAVVP